VSRAFVKEDGGSWGDPSRHYNLPDRNDPTFDEAAARALIEGAVAGDTGSAEAATGYYWGERTLRPFVERLLERARGDHDAEMVRAAERFLR
jgi:hypothetical protein